MTDTKKGKVRPRMPLTTALKGTTKEVATFPLSSPCFEKDSAPIPPIFLLEKDIISAIRIIDMQILLT